MEIQFLGRKYSTNELVKKRRAIIKNIRSKNQVTASKRMLILSGSTIGELADQLEMFCLARGIELQIIQGDYGRYYEDAVYGNPNIENSQYDFIYVHISNRNIINWPEPFEDNNAVKNKLQDEKNRIDHVISSLSKRYSCPIIFNNYEMLPYRVMGNREVYESSGTINFVNRLNEYINTFTQSIKDFYVNDINYLSAFYGIKEWSETSYWYRYKYAMNIEAIPLVAQNLSAIVLSLCGLNKKCLVTDLDNTLWGGTVGDDGSEGITIGNDSPQGEAYTAFQKYLLKLKQTGTILGIVSKNEEDIAKSGFNRSEMILKREDFASFKANWNIKSENIKNMASELNIGIDSFVFIDDNPMERDEVVNKLGMVSVPVLSSVENYIKEVEECHLFEVSSHTKEDADRTTYYIQNAMREKEQTKYTDYNEYLKSLNMSWEFRDFEKASLDRIVQLINKTNQFNLTTIRLNSSEVMERSEQTNEYICIQGRMKDKFGDNGLITVFIGKIIEDALYIELWLMSCRVFRRNGEYMLFEYLKQRCLERGIQKIFGKYIPTKKNRIVSEFYKTLGFQLIDKTETGVTNWMYKLS